MEVVELRSIMVKYFHFQAMTSLPTPPVMLLDPNDENIILGIPEDRNPNKANSVPAQVAKKVSLWLEIYIYSRLI